MQKGANLRLQRQPYLMYFVAHLGFYQSDNVTIMYFGFLFNVIY